MILTLIIIGLLLAYVAYLRWKLRDEARDYQRVIELQHQQLQGGIMKNDERRQIYRIGLSRCQTLLEAELHEALTALGNVVYRHYLTQPDLKEERKFIRARVKWVSEIKRIADELGKIQEEMNDT